MTTDLQLMHRAWPLVQRTLGDILNARVATMSMEDGQPIYYILTEPEPVVVDLQDQYILSFVHGGAKAVEVAREAGWLTDLSDEDAADFWRRLIEVFEPAGSDNGGPVRSTE